MSPRGLSDKLEGVKRPEIQANFVLSADGKISTVNRCPSKWSSAADKARYFQIRSGADAILVGRHTLQADNMSMTGDQNPWRCIVSESGNLSADDKVFRTDGGPIHIITSAPSLPSSVQNKVTFHADLDVFLMAAAQSGIERVLCEGGGQLFKSLLSADLVDVLHLTWTGHLLFGGKNAPTCTGLPGAFLPQSKRLKLELFQPSEDGTELFLTYRVLR